MEQKQVDEKEAEIRQTEERLRSKETDLEKRMAVRWPNLPRLLKIIIKKSSFFFFKKKKKELRHNETALNEKMEVYQKLQSEAKHRDKESREGMYAMYWTIFIFREKI